MITAMTMYTLSTAIHVVFVVSFLATAGAFSVIGPMAKENPQHAVFALKVEKKIYETAVFPGILVVWGTGIYQASDDKYYSDGAWLIVSVLLFLFMTIATFAVNYPSVKTALAELEAQTEPGPPSEKAQSAFKKMATLGPVMGITFMVITFLMVAQPF